MVVSIYLSKANVSSPENAISLSTENGKPSSRKNAKTSEKGEPSSLFSHYKKNGRNKQF